ncbi:hypothetical protein KY335_05160 [Candidatus Woesearchaeota archaeon]|nr:hypothetical protein [Candidatus Woesearchaeota archaeon]
MKKYAILAMILIFVFAVGCAPAEEQPIGGDRDEHGCLIGAGYQWCASKQKCLRAWEEYCEEFKEQFTIDSFEDCIAAGNPAMESYPRQCMTKDGVSYTEEVFQRAKPKYNLAQALVIAADSDCVADGWLVEDSALYNPETRTWWIDLEIEKEGCAPACVVSESGSAEINWRCTGLIPE